MKKIYFVVLLFTTFFCKAQPTTPVVDKLGNTAAVAASVITAGTTLRGFMTSNGQGWIILQGQLLTTLTTTQQTQASNLGFVGNLPDFRNKTSVGAGGIYALRSTGGIATATITSANLPNVNLTGGAHTHTTNINSWLTNLSANGGERYFGLNGTTTAATSAVVSASSGNLSIPLGGSGVALQIQNPYIAENVFIYLGL